MLRLVESFSKVFWVACLSLILVWIRVIGFPWCPVRFVSWKATVSIRSGGRVFCIAFWTLSVSSVAWADVLMSM